MDDVTRAAKILGALGGSRTTPAQAKARAINGRKGGRPRKNKVKIVLAKPERSGINKPMNAHNQNTYYIVKLESGPYVGNLISSSSGKSFVAVNLHDACKFFSMAGATHAAQEHGAKGFRVIQIHDDPL